MVARLGFSVEKPGAENLPHVTSVDDGPFIYVITAEDSDGFFGTQHRPREIRTEYPNVLPDVEVKIWSARKIKPELSRVDYDGNVKDYQSPEGSLTQTASTVYENCYSCCRDSAEVELLKNYKYVYNLGSFDAGDQLSLKITEDYPAGTTFTANTLLVPKRKIYVRPGLISINTGIITVPNRYLVPVILSIRAYRSPQGINLGGLVGFDIGGGAPKTLLIGAEIELADKVGISSGLALNSDGWVPSGFVGATFDVKLFGDFISKVTKGFGLLK